jgi:2-isopropylmalate synthase
LGPQGPVVFYDTTLRDGTQQLGVSLSTEDKLQLLCRFAEFGFDYVEGGWPGSNRKDLEFFRRARDLDLGETRLVAFGATRRAGLPVEEDASVRALVEAGAPAVCVVGKAWGLHVREALRTTPDENLAMIGDTVRHLKAHGLEVCFDAEHFFSGTEEDAGYALEVVRAAASAGADWVVLCDTNGGSLPSTVARWTEAAARAVPGSLGIHTHDDGGLGVANALAALEAGATQVQGTVNGYGERCGNANLCTLLASVVLKLGRPCRAAPRLKELTRLSRFVSEACNLPPTPGAPYVGPNAFAHKGGIHVSGILRNTATYEHVSPDAVGNTREVVVSELAGGSNLEYKFQELGLEPNTPEARRDVLARVKTMEFDGYQFEGAEASFELLARRVLGSMPRFFDPVAYTMSVSRSFGGREGSGPGGEADGAEARAKVCVRVAGRRFEREATGAGPVNAMDRALRAALEAPYPEIQGMRLADYRVRVIDGRLGTASRVRVQIATESPSGYWTTVGVSDNVLDASWIALGDGFAYGLLQGGAAVATAAAASGSGA